MPQDLKVGDPVEIGGEQYIVKHVGTPPESSEEPTWDELLSETGKGIEDIGRMLRGRGRKKPRVWSIEELMHLRSALMTHRKLIKYYIEHLQDEAKNTKV